MIRPKTLAKVALAAFAFLFCGHAAAQEKMSVAVLEPVGEGAVTAINKASARGTLEDFLSRSSSYKVLDRAHTDKVFIELGYQRNSGMVSDSDAKKIGVQLGADAVCVSEIIKEEGEANVTVSIINVETGEKSTRNGFIEEDSNRAINDLIVTLASRLTAVVAPPSQSGTRKSGGSEPQSSPVGTQDPRIAVIIPEFHISARIPDPAGETAVIRKLLEAGFSNLVDPNAVKAIRESDQVKALMRGDIETAKGLATQLGVDCIIVGEAFSERVPGTLAGGMVSCRARVEARLIRTDTAQIIATHGFHQGGVDLAEFNAAKVALNKAGEKMGEYMAQQLRARGSIANTQIKLTVMDLTSFNRLSELEQALKGLREINNVYRREYVGGVATIDLDSAVTAQALAPILEGIKSPRLNVIEASGSAIKVSVR